MTDTIRYGYVGDIIKKDVANRMVWAVATGPKEDLDHQGMDVEWLKEAMPTYMKRGNIRQMHNAKLPPAGKAKEAIEQPDGDWVLGVKVVDKEAWEKVEEGVYTGLSVGIMDAVVKASDVFENGLICGGNLMEVSLVDYPAYQYSELKTDRATLVKRAKKLKVVSFDFVPSDTAMTVKYVSPSMVIPGKTTPEDALMLTGKKDYSSDERDGMSDSGEAMADGSFPIKDREDLDNAVQAYGRAKDKEAAKEHIMTRAKALDAEDALPENWTDKSTDEVADEDKATDPETEKAKSSKDEDDDAGETDDEDSEGDDDEEDDEDDDKAAEPDATKELELSGEEAQHNGPLNAARSAIKELISQELTESEPEVDCVSTLASIWSQLEYWAEREAREEAGVMDLWFGAVANVTKEQNAKAVLPALDEVGKTLMTQAKEKAAEAEVEKAGRTISAATAASLLSLAGAAGVPADIAGQLRTLAGQVDGTEALEPDVSGTTTAPGVTDGLVDSRAALITPTALDLTSAEAGGGAMAGAMTSPAFDRSTAAPVKTLEDADITKTVEEAVAKALEAALKPLIVEVAKSASLGGAVAKTVDAVEATHSETLTKIAEAKDELTKAVDDKVAELSKTVTDQLDRVKKMAAPSKAVAAEGLVPAEKHFNTNPDEVVKTTEATKLADLLSKARDGDLNAQAALREAFTGADREVAAEAYVATHDKRG